MSWRPFNIKNFNRWILSLTLACIFLTTSTYRDLHIQLAHDHDTHICQDHKKAPHFHAGSDHDDTCQVCHYFIPAPLIVPKTFSVVIRSPQNPALCVSYPIVFDGRTAPDPSQRGPPAEA